MAPVLGASYFDKVVTFAEELLPLYLRSPVKRNEREVLKEYFRAVEQTSDRLLANGAIPPAETGGPAGSGSSLALVPRDNYTSLQWCVITERADMPLVLMNAVDAAKRRNYLVDSVLEPLFEFMLALDPSRALSWQLELCKGQNGQPVDPDVARDILRVWRGRRTLPKEHLKLIVELSEDDRVFRHWPAVIEEADRLLRVQALSAWVESRKEACRSSRQLQYLAPYRDDRRLNRWLRQALEILGTSIDFFIKQSELQSEGESRAAWRHSAMMRELGQLERLMPPILLMSDLLLLAPTGSYDFAMAIFGFTRDYKRCWESALEECSKKAIRKRFLEDLKEGRPPLSTIKSLCFGNLELEERVTHELDSLTQNFDSFRQREVVIEKLCGIYSSFHEQRLLNEEVGRRYRRMMRVLHEDSLRRVLGNELMNELDGLRSVLLDLSVIASQSRRFLAMRRALDRSTAEVIAADMDFTQSMRSLRAAYVRRLLDI